MSIPIPQPPGLPFLGNILDVDGQNALLSLMDLAEKYGPIYKLKILSTEMYMVGSANLLTELCDETRFCKVIAGALEEVRAGVGDGLFTAHRGEHNWDVAHRTLVPAFGPLAIKDMFDEMYDVSAQLVSKWARTSGEGAVINVTEDFTRLTLDTIALCAMDKRFNSFYRDEMHPFVDAMVDFLVESGVRDRRTRIEQWLYPEPERKFQANIKLMKDVAQEVVDKRRANPSTKKDLLNAMLIGKDPVTGEHLTDESVMNNMLTFLIAGHETTSGMLSFACYYLLKDPEVYRKAQEEVDRVVGKGQVAYQHLSKLTYIEAVLRETLRLQPTAPGFTVQPLPEGNGPVVIGGGYHVPPGAALFILLATCQRDPKVYGEDANEFRPERMFPEELAKRPAGAWKPFGSGSRGCIGRAFAWQEALMVLALILQNFNLKFDDESYEMHIKQTLTIKPDKMFMRATLRDGIDPINLEKKMFSGAGQTTNVTPSQGSKTAGSTGKPITILYGSNSGTCEGLAQTLASSAGSRGFTASVKPLDAATSNLPVDQPVVFITASYEGNPPDNAVKFVDWLKAVDTTKVNGAKYAVFGCGHRDWVATYQKVPTFIDTELASKGASRIATRGETNAAAGTIFDDFDTWQDDLLWPALVGIGDAKAPADLEGLDMEISNGTRSTAIPHNVEDALVLKNERLTAPDVPEKRHMEFKMPSSLTYQPGDYLAILPINNIPTISRVLRRFALPWDSMMKLKKGAHAIIPTEKELSVTVVLGAYVELNSPATKKNLATLATYITDDAQKGALAKLDTASLSILEILEKFPQINLPFSVYLAMSMTMRMRQYSISSSPLADPSAVSIIYSVFGDDREDEARLGVATNYLRHLKPGSTVQLTIKKAHSSFYLPIEDSTPIIMVAAGTGLAPFRGFIQERAAKIAEGRTMGAAALFIGHRDPVSDALHASELREWETAGAVKVYHAYSRAPEQSEDCKYAQDRLWKEKKLVTDMFFKAGARAYICGSARLGKGVADIVCKIAVANAKEEGEEDYTYEKAMNWWEGLRGERYAVDVFD